jgi:hypothetical protein
MLLHIRIGCNTKMAPDASFDTIPKIWKRGGAEALGALGYTLA